MPAFGKPMATDIIDKVRQIVASNLFVEEDRISQDTTFDDLEADSLEVSEIAIAIEEAFNIRVPDWAADQFVTVGDAIAFVQAQLQLSR
jgi:acyl carrier protein